MKKIIFTALSVFLIYAITGCESTPSKKNASQPVVPGGYEGIYVVKTNEGDKSVLPVGITGLVLKRTGKSYDVILSNINMKAKSAEEIEKLQFTWSEGQFDIKFGASMKLKPVENGLEGTLDFKGKPAKIIFKKIK